MSAQKLRFSYNILGRDGTCDAVSAAQAVNLAKVRYIFWRWGIRPKSPEFPREMSALKQTRVTLELHEDHLRRFVVLYRAAKDGDLLQSEKPEFKQLSSILRDPLYK